MAVSTVCFVLLPFIKQPFINLTLLLLAKSGYSWTGTMICTYYCPRFGDTGRISFLAGFLDAVSYLFAAIAGQVFSGALDSIGWTNMIFIWAALMALGGIVTFLPYAVGKKKTEQA